MIRWFIVDDTFFVGRPGKPVKVDVCTCEEREEGYRICDTCFTEHIGWVLWMRKADDRLFC